MLLRYNLRYGLFLAACDTLIIVAALTVASYLRIRLDIGVEGAPEAFFTPAPIYPISVALWLFSFGRNEGYKASSVTRVTQLLNQLISRHLFASLLFLGVLYVTFRDYSRLQSVYFLSISLFGIVTYRGVLHFARHALAHYINNQRRILIIGTDAHAQTVGQAIAGHGFAGLNLIGYIRAALSEHESERDIAPPIGTLPDLAAIVQREQVNEVIIARQWMDQQAVALVTEIMRMLGERAVNIRLASDYSELAYFRAHAEDFGSLTLVGLRESVLTPIQNVIKRAFDVLFSLLILIFTAPLVPLIALAIRLDSPGAVIFRQQRVGQHGRRFTIYKFRTMYAEYANDPQGTPEQYAKRRGDPRVTRVGRFLRRTSLDELPQFFNVLRGDMSVVGPRPEIAVLVDQYDWFQRKRLEVPQGITGWWQTNGRANRPLRTHIEDDLYYVRNYSIWFDMVIILRTVFVVLTGKGAY